MENSPGERATTTTFTETTKIKETKCAERKQELQVLYKAEQSLKNKKIVGQTDGIFPLAFSAVDQNSGEATCAVKGE